MSDSSPSRAVLPLTVYLIAVGAFALGMASYVTAGLMPLIASAFSISLAMAAQLVTAFTLAYGLGSPLVVALLPARAQRTGLLLALAVFVLANGASALAPGFASLLAWRVSQQQPLTFSIAVNDYGLELLSATEVQWPQLLNATLLSPQDLLADVIASLNAGELALRRFREIARIAGLVFAGYPGAPKSTRQVQASSGLFFEVFKQYDPQNLLLAQAGEEVLRDELDIRRLEHTLNHLSTLRLDLHTIQRPTPLAFPLLVERMRESMSSEKLSERIARMVKDLEKVADKGQG